LAVISAYPRSQTHRPAVRTAGRLALCLFEALVTYRLFEFKPEISHWQSPLFYLHELVLWVLFSTVAFGMLSWPQRAEALSFWREEQARHNWRLALAVNLTLFAALVPATIAFTAHAAAAPSPPWGLFWAYSVLLVATGISLARLDLSIRSLCAFLHRYRLNVAIAGLMGLVILLISAAAMSSWDALSGATFWLTRGLLELYETGVAGDAAERVLQVGDFAVKINDTCSGYEGIGLVTAFLVLYLWVFRGRLRFPHAFLLVPVGTATIWVLNSLRIAALTSLGAHVSPEVAVRGFHSQAGWIAFLAVAVGIMALAHRVPFISADQRVARPAGRASDRIVLAYLAPFIALMLTSVIMAAAAPHDRPLYALKVAAVGLTLWALRDVYRSWPWRVSPVSVLAGVVVGAAWIATDPAPAAGEELRAWLGGQSAAAGGIWLGLRVVGATVTVPIAEELAFRGFLHRWLISRDFDSVPVGRVSILAFIVSSLLFGLMHERWMAGALSGAVFALLMYRTNRLSDPIAAHVTANGTICAWAIAFGQWSLL